MSTSEIVVTIIVALISSGFLQFAQFWFDRRTRKRQGEAAAAKDESDAHLTIAEAGEKTLKMAFETLDRQAKEQKELRCTINDLGRTVSQQTGEISRLKAAYVSFTERINYLMGGIAVLIGQITDGKGVPCWQPDEWDPPDVEE